jgi:hypothetical protein
MHSPRCRNVPEAHTETGEYEPTSGVVTMFFSTLIESEIFIVFFGRPAADGA